MKIMFNTMGLGKGGAERVINILSNSFINKNDVMIVANINSKCEYRFDNRVIIRSLVKKSNKFLRKLRRISPFMILKLKKLILEYNPDVIISFLPEPSFRVLFLKKYAKKIKKIPVVVSVRNDPNTEYSNKVYYFIMKKLYPLANKLILQTNDAKKYFDSLSMNGIVIPNPVSDVFLADSFNGIREKRIVAVGRLEPQKNYINMIDAFEIVSKKYHDYIFNIYGDGYLRNELQEYIDSKKLHDKIMLMGMVDNVKDSIYKAKVFVMSSDYEGMPNSLLEAACLGVPCVSTDCPCGGPRDILDNGKGGILVEVNNSEKLANGIIKMIENSEYSDKCSQYTNNNAYKYDKNTIIKRWLKEISKGAEE